MTAFRIWRRLALGAVGLFAAGVAVVVIAMRLLGPPPLDAAGHLSMMVLDRNGQLLRAFTTPEGLWRLPVEPEDVDQRYIRMLLAFEDRRFHQHGGVDPVALGRAVVQFVSHGRIVSGGSTLTMQVARLLDGAYGKDAPTKLKQMVRALQLERQLDKREILRL